MPALSSIKAHQARHCFEQLYVDAVQGQLFIREFYCGHQNNLNGEVCPHMKPLTACFTILITIIIITSIIIIIFISIVISATIAITSSNIIFTMVYLFAVLLVLSGAFICKQATFKTCKATFQFSVNSPRYSVTSTTVAEDCYSIMNATKSSSHNSRSSPTSLGVLVS